MRTVDREGKPFDLKAFLADNPALSDADLADKVRYALLRRMERERTLVFGPTKKTLGRIQDDLLRSPRIRKHIESEARGSNRSVAKVEKEARKELSKLCANQQPYVVAKLAQFLDWVWNRIYDGIVIDEDGIERLREKARDGAIVLLPGVGRKTANVITSVIDAQPNMAVDTHVFRVSARIGLTTRAKTVLAAEKQLIQHIPAALVHKAHHWLILHGRYTCLARSPRCSVCGLRVACKFYQNNAPA